jgi:hypothetical protein
MVGVEAAEPRKTVAHSRRMIEQVAFCSRRIYCICSRQQLAHSATRQALRALVRSWGLSGPISYGLSRVVFRQHVPSRPGEFHPESGLVGRRMPSAQRDGASSWLLFNKQSPVLQKPGRAYCKRTPW